MTDLEQYIDYLHDLACHTEDKLAATPFCEWETDEIKEMQATSTVLIVQLSMADDFHREYYGLPARETPLVPLQRANAASASATPHRSAKASRKAPAGVGATPPGSRAGSTPAGPGAACLPNKDATPEVLRAGVVGPACRARAAGALAGLPIP